MIVSPRKIEFIFWFQIGNFYQIITQLDKNQKLSYNQLTFHSKNMDPDRFDWAKPGVRHPNIRSARGTPNMPDEPMEIDPEAEKPFDQAQAITGFNHDLEHLLQTTPHSKETILRAIALTCGDTPVSTLQNWLKGKPVSERVASLFVRQASYFDKNPQELTKLSQTMKWK